MRLVSHMQLYKLCTAQGYLVKEHAGAKEQRSLCVQSDQKSVIFSLPQRSHSN